MQVGIGLESGKLQETRNGNNGNGKKRNPN